MTKMRFYRRFAVVRCRNEIGTFACARLLGGNLPVNEVGNLLEHQNKLLALAAERYLESEDSPEARNLVLKQTSEGEALILGARDSFDPAKVWRFTDAFRIFRKRQSWILEII